MKDDVAKKVVEAKKQIIDGAFTIWNARLDLLRSAGDIRGVLDHINAALEDKINNCGCNVQCGAASDLGSIVNPAVRG